LVCLSLQLNPILILKIITQTTHKYLIPSLYSEVSLNSLFTFPKEYQLFHTSSWVCPRVSKFLHVSGTSLISTSATTRSSLLLLLVRPLPGACSCQKRKKLD
jgi:hypothetical protein